MPCGQQLGTSSIKHDFVLRMSKAQKNMMKAVSWHETYLCSKTKHHMIITSSCRCILLAGIKGFALKRFGIQPLVVFTCRISFESSKKQLLQITKLFRNKKVSSLRHQRHSHAPSLIFSANAHFNESRAFWHRWKEPLTKQIRNKSFSPRELFSRALYYSVLLKRFLRANVEGSRF